MKKIGSLLCLVLVMFSLSACREAGKTSGVHVAIGESDKFTSEEIKDAIASVKRKFRDFNGSTLTDLWYDEENSNDFIEGYLSHGKGSVNGATAEHTIVLLSNFDVDSSGGDGTLNPDSTYSDWNWILIRKSRTDSWQVDDWGY